MNINQQAQAVKFSIQQCTDRYSFEPKTAPAKMRPHILGDNECKVAKEKIEEIKKAFDAKKDVKNAYVFCGTAGDKCYFFKKRRKFTQAELLANPLAEVLVTPDSPAYRVRKAAKIERWIEKNKYDGAIVVPKKYLFWDETYNEWYSVAEAIDLDDNAIVSIADQDGDSVENELISVQQGQSQKFFNLNVSKKDLTVRQAYGLATLAFEAGYTDMSYNNFFFDKSGRVAIVDTESLDRGVKKFHRGINFSMIISDRLFNDWGSRSVRAGLLATAKLKLFCKNVEAKKAVESVETRYALWALAKTVGKIALAILAIKAITVLSAVAAVPAVCVVAFKVVSIVAQLKIVAYLWHAGATGYIFYMNREGYAGLQKVQALAKKAPIL